HDQTFKRRQTHRRIDGTSSLYCGCRAAVAQMERDDVGLFARQSSHRAIAKSDVAMRGTMESVPPDAVPPIKMIRNGIQIGLLGKRMMKGSVEHRYLGNVFAE